MWTRAPGADAERGDDAVAPPAARGAGDDEGHVGAGHDVERQTGERRSQEDRPVRQQGDPGESRAFRSPRASSSRAGHARQHATRLDFCRPARPMRGARRERGGQMESPRQRSVSLQMKMLIGFLIGLVAGLSSTRPSRAPPGSARLHHLCHRADRPDLPAPAVHAGHPAAVLGAGRRHRRDGRHPRAEADRHQDPGLHGPALVDRGRDRLAVANLFQPGAGVDPALAQAMLADRRRAGASAIVSPGAEQPAGVDAFVNIIPNNVVTRRRATTTSSR